MNDAATSATLHGNGGGRSADDSSSTSLRWSFVVMMLVVSSGLVLAGAWAGFRLLDAGRPIPYGEEELLLRFLAWDGGQFMQIMDEGYHFVPGRMSNVVVFPGYPVAACAMQWLTGWRTPVCLLVVSNGSLLLAIVLFRTYLIQRCPDSRAAMVWCLAALVFLPTTFFMRMAYSESLFLLLAISALLGTERKWHPLKVAVLIGAATAVRLAGLALLPVLLRVVLERRREHRLPVPVAAGLFACGVWGLLAYMLYLQVTFGDGFAFARGQAEYRLRPPTDVGTHVLRLLALEPVWGNYLAGSETWWRNHAPQPAALWNLQFANPIWFLTTCALVFAGLKRRWLNVNEVLFCVGVLAISYAGRGEEFCMGCQGRYASVTFPACLVAGRILATKPFWLSASVMTASAVLLTVYSAYFSAWYFFL